MRRHLGRLPRLAAVLGGAGILILLLASCATTYGPLGYNGGYGGFQESKTEYYVSFLANSSTTRQTAYRFFLTRAAQIALKRGYKYFYVYHLQDSSRGRYYVTPGSTRTYIYRDVTPRYFGEDGFLDVRRFRQVTVFVPPSYTEIDAPGYRGQVVLVKHRIKGQPPPFDARILYRSGMRLSDQIQTENRRAAVAAGVGTVIVVGVATLATFLAAGGTITIGAPAG